MFAFFLLPAVMAIGGSLVSVPIIIHLINRMRFRKVRWAAMEFLLKSQKRNRRRLIIEQILLLLLRCLLVLLAAFLMARFLGCDATGSLTMKTTAHYVVLDDSLSMKDHWQDEKAGGVTTSFDTGKAMILEIARSAVLANAAQEVRVVRLTEPNNPVFDEKLTDEGIRRLEASLADLKGTDLANKLPDSPDQTKLVDALDKGKEYFEGKLGQKIVHLVGDFRQADWTGPPAEKLQNTVQDHCKAATNVNLVDCANPLRNEKTKEVTGNHDNLGVVDLRPDSRIVAVGMPVQFTLTVQNFSNAALDNVFVTVKVDGQEKLEASSPIPKVTANGTTRHTFQTTFTTKGVKQITATLPKEAVGLDEDNKRFAVVEVRDQVEVLIVDGNGKAGTKEGGDTYYLQTVFTSGRGFKVVAADSPNVLDGGGLDRFAAVYLLNVPNIRSDKGRKNLEDYVKEGGSVCFFLGDKLDDRGRWYNEFLYKNGEGIFPVPLDEANGFLYQKIGDKEKELLRNDGTQKVFLRKKDHPAFTDWYDYPWYFEPMVIEGYWRTKPRNQWIHPEGKTPVELMTLPNQKPIEGYRDRANALIKKLDSEEADLGKFKKTLERHQRGLRDALSGSQLATLALAFQTLREDQGDAKNPERPNLVKEFWNLEQTKALKDEIDQFLAEIQYGDPLAVERRVGRGKSVAFLTTAGTAWNDWGGKSPATVTYAPIMMEMQKYLTNSGDESNLLIGSKLNIDLDASRYEAKVHKYFQPEIAEQGPPGAPPPPGQPGLRPGLTDRGEQPGAVTNDRVRWLFEEMTQPGVYLFDFTFKPDSLAAQPKVEQKAFVFNVDTLSEGDLKRAAPTDLERNPTSTDQSKPVGKVKLYTGKEGFGDLAQKKEDASESPWIYLIIMAVLVFEQALAVHLSFHLRGTDAAAMTRSSAGKAA